MKQLAVVQFFTWLGLFCMWLFFVPAMARHVFGATDPQSELYTQGIEWGGLAFAFYSITCFVVAFALPKLAAATSRKAVHAGALVCGGAGLLSVYVIHDQYLLLLRWSAWGSPGRRSCRCPTPSSPARCRRSGWASTWASSTSSSSSPRSSRRSASGPSSARVRRDNPDAPLYVVMIGGVCLLAAAAAGDAACTTWATADVPEGAVIDADEHEPFGVQGSVQPVPSTGLVDEPGSRPS